jgi:hypothetical protein
LSTGTNTGEKTPKKPIKHVVTDGRIHEWRILASFLNLWYNCIHMKTHLTIQQVGSPTNTGRAGDHTMTGLLVAFMTLFGLVLGVTLHERVPYPGEAREQLAAPDLNPSSTLGTSDTLVVPTPEIAGSQDVRPEATPPAATDLALATTPSPEAEIRTQNELINTEELAIMQLTGEMELIKNASVTLIAEFETNCGNWKDTCGSTYASGLESLNVRYAGLVERLHEAERRRGDAQSERARLMNAGE